ncbi:MAG: glycosyltransferase family 2 protein [Planctomycetota bacterium]
MAAVEPTAPPRGDRPLVSVIVPFYERERYIAACIESLLSQEGVDGGRSAYEIVLIDNRSTDSSAAIARSYDGVTVLEEAKQGAYAARNAGIRHARAPILAFTDADCVVAKDWLRTILGGFEDPATGMLVGHCRYPKDASPLLRMLGAYENAKTHYVLTRCSSAHHFCYANNLAVRTSVFEEIGLFEEWPRAADSELVHRLAARRPDLAVRFCADMRVTHLEFLQGMARMKRLSLYTHTNAKIQSFRELTFGQRLGVVGHMLWGRRASS